MRRERQVWNRCLAVFGEGAAPSIIVILVIVTDLLELLEVELVAKDTANTTEALHELVALRRTVGDELKVGTKLAEVLSQPLEERHLVDDFHLLASLGVHELFTVLLLQLRGVKDDLCSLAALELPAGDLQVLEDDESLGSAGVKSLECVLNTVTDLAAVHADLVEVSVDELLLLNELDVAEGLGGKFDSLVETVLTTVRNVNNLDDLDCETLVEQIGLVEIGLEIGTTGKNETSAVALVVGDEVLNSQLGDLADVVVTLLLTQTGETQGGLTTTAVLLGQIDGELLQDFSGVAGKGTEESTVAVHDDESILGVGLEQLAQGLGVELVVTEVQRGVDRLEGLEVDVDLPLLTLGCDDFTAVDDQAVGRDLGVELEPLLGGGNGGQDGETVDTRLDIGSGAELFSQHLGGARDLVLRRDDEGNHGGSISAGSFQALNELLDLPDLDVLVGLGAGALLFGGHDGRLCWGKVCRCEIESGLKSDRQNIHNSRPTLRGAKFGSDTHTRPHALVTSTQRSRGCAVPRCLS